MIITRRALTLLLGLAPAACGDPPRADADVAAIENLMRATWDRPEAPLTAGPIAVSGDHAIADWTQGEMGGRALLARREGRWTVLLCAGDSIRTEAGLLDVGVPAPAAKTLARDLAELERAVSPDRLLTMSRFEGVVRMGTE